MKMLLKSTQSKSDISENESIDLQEDVSKAIKIFFEDLMKRALSKDLSFP